MILTLKRHPSENGATLGELYVNDVPECNSLEDELREVEGEPVEKWKIPGETAIPQGRYRVIITHSPKFNKPLPLLVEVPGFHGIRIHSGNVESDTDGCILVGEKSGSTAIINSRKCLAELQEQIQDAIDHNEQVFIEITNPDA